MFNFYTSTLLTNFTEPTLPTAIRCRQKNLAEKVGELTDFTNFGAEEKISTDIDRHLALVIVYTLRLCLGKGRTKGPKVQFFFSSKSVETFLFFILHQSLFIIIQIKNTTKQIFSLFHSKHFFFLHQSNLL
jgi:hypothetical protein